MAFQTKESLQSKIRLERRSEQSELSEAYTAVKQGSVFSPALLCMLQERNLESAQPCQSHNSRGQTDRVLETPPSTCTASDRSKDRLLTAELQAVLRKSCH